jgi:hypothetical protein
MKTKALAVRPILGMAENRAKWCPVPGRSPSSHARYPALFGLVALLIVMAGCGSSGSGTLIGPAAGPSIYLTQENFTLSGPPLPSNILQFPTTANGTVSPIATLTGPANVVFSGLAVDGTGTAYVGGEIFGSGGGSGGPPLTSVEILAYASGASGTQPTRTITSTSLLVSGGINALAVDSSGNLYVSAILAAPNLGSGIAIFSPTAGANAVPIRVIGGSATTIVGVGPMPIAVDTADNIYISNADPLAPESVLIFNSSANGNVPPSSTISGPTTTINSIKGLATDSAGNVYVSNFPSDPTALPEILEFSAGSTGNVAPIRTISGPATTMTAGGNLALDSTGNIYVLNTENLLVFAPNSTGNVAPNATITTATSLIFDYSIAVH